MVTEVLMRGRHKFNLWYSITTMITYDFLSHDLDVGYSILDLLLVEGLPFLLITRCVIVTKTN